MSLLQDRIRAASQKYYSGEESGVSDKEFDQMLDQLKEEDPSSPLLTEVGHGYEIELDSTAGQKVQHRYLVPGSLDKCHNWKELNKSFKNETMEWCSLKLDGLSVVLYYELGRLIQAVTRGKNGVGIDITDKVKYIMRYGCDLNQDTTFTGAIRGEILMSHANFEIFQEAHPEAMNSRNSAAGLINASGISPELSLLDIIVYTVVGVDSNIDTSRFETYLDMHKWLAHNYDKVVPMCGLILREDTFMDEMATLQSDWYNAYPADGIVITSREVEFRSSANPDEVEVAYNSQAFKFKAESAITTVTEIDWNLSKTKYIIPRILFDTVQLSGTNVSACAGNNADFIRKNGLGPGAKIEVLKSGEIIPYLEKVHETAEPQLPSNCPHCCTPLIWKGVHLMCPNKECGDAQIQDVLVWMQTIAPYDGLGDTLKLKFLEVMFGDDITIENIYGHGELNVEEGKYVKLHDFQVNFNQLFTNKVKLADAIRALNIPRFGDVTSAKLAQYPDQVKTLIFAAMHPDALLDMHGVDKLIGDANAKSLAEHYKKFERLWYIQDNIIWDEPKPAEMKGKVAITGKLGVKRSVFEQELKDAGYIPGSIAKDTKFLITDDPDSTSSKNKKADEWGITKITELEFRTQYLNR